MDADDLFGVPLDQFIPERTALAKALRAEGRRDEAKEVAAIRKPSVAAWAVNQLLRSQPKAVRELMKAGDALRAAQDQVLAGKGDRQGLRAAAEQERSAVGELVKAARGLLTSDGHELSPTVMDRVSETLHAAALDEEARSQVEGGRLQHELRHVGFGVGGGGLGAAAPAAPRRSAGGGKQTAKTDNKGRAATRGDAGARGGTQRAAGDTQERDRAREERRLAERERAAALKAAREAEGEARRAAQRAARALEVAQERHHRAAEALGTAEDELEQARSNADAAADAHQGAVAELHQLSGRESE